MKRVMLLMKNEELMGVDNERLMDEFKEIMKQSLEWWHDYLGQKDRLALHKWKMEAIFVSEGGFAELAEQDQKT